MKFIKILLLLISVNLTINASAAADVIYPAPESPNDTRHNDLIEMITMSLEKTKAEYGPYSIKPADLVMNEARSLLMLKQGKAVNIVWSSTSIEKEQDFLPIRIPLRKGILGYRICLINIKKQKDIDNIKNKDDLKKILIGQGFGWGDISLYELNGIKVFSADYENLFSMLASGRFDIFPRGISEAFTEYNERKDIISGLAVEKNLLIYYPWPFYCFFNRDDKLLKERIELGLRKMIADGSFDFIFRKYNEKWIIQGDLKNRRIIRITNPFLPKETPVNDKKLWFDPFDY